MRKLIRIAAIVVGVFVLVVIAVRVFVPTEKWVQLAFDQLHARTGLRASAQDVAVSFPWPIGIKLQQLEVDGPEGRPQAARVKGHAGEALVTADLASLLRRKPQIREVRLKQPDFEVWLPQPAAADSSGTAPVPGAPPHLPPNAAFAIGLLSVDDGRLVVHGPGGRETRVAGIQQRARLRLQESGALTGSLQTELAQLVLTDPARPHEFTLEKLASQLRLEGDLRARKGTVTVAELSAWGSSLRGPIELDFGTGRGMVQAKLTLEADLPQLMAALAPQLPPPPRGMELPQVRAGHAQGEVRIAGELPVGAVSRDDLLALLAGEGEVSQLQLSALGRADLVAASLRWALAGGSVRVEGLTARLPGVTATGSLTSPANGQGDLRGKLALNVDVGAAAGLLKELWPRLPQQARAGKQDPSQWPGMQGALDANVDLKIALGRPLDPQLTPVLWDATLHHLSIQHPQLPDTLHVRAGKASGTMLKADFYNIAVDGPGVVKGNLNGGLTGWPARVLLTATGQFAQLDLDALMPPAKRAAGAAPDGRKAWLRGVLPREARAAPAPAGALPVPPENFAARFVVRADQLKTRGYRVSDVLARGELEQQVLHVTTLQAKMGTGTIEGTAGVDWTVPTPTWSIDANAAAIPAAEVLAPVAGALARALSTTLSGAVKLAGPVAGDPVVVQSQLTGDCSAEAQEGKLQTEPLLGQQLARLLGAAEAKRFDVLDFKRLSTLVKIRDGKVLIDDLVLDGPTSVAAKGSIGLVDRRVDYGLTVRLPAGVTPDLGAFTAFASLLRDEQGRITVALRVTGPAQQPKIELDLAQLQQRVKQGGPQQLKDKLRQLLPGGDAPGGTPAGDGAAGAGSAPADSLARQKAQDAVKDLLGGLRKKKGLAP